MKFLFLIYVCCILPDAFGQFETKTIHNKLDSIVFPLGKATNKPGVAAAIFKNDTIVYFSTAGLANIQKELPITLKTQFNIGSVTKMFTAAAILLLEEEGKLNRNDNINKYIPELILSSPIVTINNLLSHTAGMRTHFELSQFLFNYKTNLATFPAMIKYINKYNDLNFETGENFAYSNTGYMLLAMIIERVSGETYANYLNENIFVPLGMHSTYVSSGKVKYLTDGTASYRTKTNGKTRRPYAYLDAIGATGVNSTMYDMHLWDNNFYNNKLGKGNNTLIDTLTKSFNLNSGESVHYGCGVIIKSFRSKPVVEHSGGWGEYLFQYRRFPEEHTAILAWNNASNYSPFVIVDNLSNAIFYYNDNAHKNIDIRPAFNQEMLTGTFITSNNFIRKVEVINDTLVLKLPLNQSNRYHPLIFTGPANDSIIQYIDTAGNTVKFHKSGEEITGFSWAGGEYFVAQRLYKKIIGAAENKIVMPIGKYYLENHSNYINVSYNKRKDAYYLSPFPFFKYKIEPVHGNIFHLDYYDYYIRVEEDSLLIGDDWIFNLRYIKK